MVTCHDPRHDEPCPDPFACSACMEECSPKYWLEEDGTRWEDGGLTLTASGRQAIRKR